jgi:hypothetical protein
MTCFYALFTPAQLMGKKMKKNKESASASQLVRSNASP